MQHSAVGSSAKTPSSNARWNSAPHEIEEGLVSRSEGRLIGESFRFSVSLDEHVAVAQKRSFPGCNRCFGSRGQVAAIGLIRRDRLTADCHADISLDAGTGNHQRPAEHNKQLPKSTGVTHPRIVATRPFAATGFPPGTLYFYASG